MNAERNGHPKITLYAERASTTRKGVMLVLRFDYSPNVSGRMICLTGWIVCPAKPNKVVATSSTYASSNYIRLKAS